MDSPEKVGRRKASWTTVAIRAAMGSFAPLRMTLLKQCRPQATAPLQLTEGLSGPPTLFLKPQLSFCDVALPVPLDAVFTYDTGALEPVVGGRVVVPFGKGSEKRLSGVVTRVHCETPKHRAKRVLQVLDTQPVLDEALLALGKWIASTTLRRSVRSTVACCPCRRVPCGVRLSHH